MRVRHKGGSKEIVRVERMMADTWVISGQRGMVHSAQSCLVSTRERIPRNMSD